MKKTKKNNIVFSLYFCIYSKKLIWTRKVIPAEKESANTEKHLTLVPIEAVEII